MGEQKFKATHTIHHDGEGPREVMLIDGIAYDRAEWEAWRQLRFPADYELYQGAWLFQGEPFPGTVTRIPPTEDPMPDQYQCGACGKRVAILTDTERLNWIENENYPLFLRVESGPHAGEWFDTTTVGSDYSPTLRQAIDAAIRIGRR